MRAAVRQIDDAVHERWQQVNAGTIPPGRATPELAAEADLSDYTVKHIELLYNLAKAISTMVNKSILMGPLGPLDHLYIRRELRKMVKTLEESADDILESLGRSR
ncbi:hypothetical protein E1264_25850 [Actinomadura sp. KC216]|uniref:hypothetical protein n=1 Tax=Actinomadura sp. KC216 TaxID=2530370 RepID=UPI0010449899|nr:hypothetical protein [Actinomadura sp. KC216]TDB84091.1 hypothetical protein E1264_25850 [Actinomadura sp. KC216]